MEEKLIEEMAIDICYMQNKGMKCNVCDTACDCRMFAKALYNAGYRKQREWISIDERLPENDWGKHWKERKYYLVITAPSGLMNVATYGSGEHGWWVDGHACVLDEKNYNRVTHWMPLPEPPKMKGGEEE